MEFFLSANGYIIAVAEGQTQYLYCSESMEIEGMAVLGNTWCTLEQQESTMVIVPAIPEAFAIDAESINPEYATLMPDIIEIGTSYSFISLEKQVGGDLKDKTYKHIPGKARFKDSIPWDSFGTIQSSIHVLEDTENNIDIYINSAENEETHETILYIGYYTDTANYMIANDEIIEEGTTFNANTWYKMEDETITEEAPEEFTISDTADIRESYFETICVISYTEVSLEKELEEVSQGIEEAITEATSGMQGQN